jgi:5S rRNA maturation endonuclease (ribonuclease M5)
MNARVWLESVCGPIRWRGEEGTCHCPLPTHGSRDRHPSFSVNAAKGTFFCHKENLGGGLRKLAQLTGRPLPDADAAPGTGGEPLRISATYDYRDESGALRYQVVRLIPKSFRLRRPDPARPGNWLWNLGDCEALPYRLPELLAALAAGETIFVVEGEKDADALASLGLMATTNHGGAGKWTLACSRHFPAGAKIAVLADNDRPGRAHALQVARKLADRGCEVHRIELDGLPAKGDVADWLAAGGDREKLLRLVAAQQAQEEFPFTDLGNAERFAQRQAGQLRYCRSWKKWLVWSGRHWEIDATGEAERRAAETVRHILALAAGLPDEKQQQAMTAFARASESASRLHSMLALAETQPALVAVADDFDADPWLFNTQTGLLDLRQDRVLVHEPDQLVTKVAPVGYDPAATCPGWNAFFAPGAGRTRGSDPLPAKSGRLFTDRGHERTVPVLAVRAGRQRQKHIPVDHHGDSAFLCPQLPMDSLLVHANRQIPNDLAALRSVRFVSAVEADDGARLAESLIKQMTGQDKIAARFLHGEWFEFAPQFSYGWPPITNRSSGAVTKPSGDGCG